MNSIRASLLVQDWCRQQRLQPSSWLRRCRSGWIPAHTTVDKAFFVLQFRRGNPGLALALAPAPARAHRTTLAAPNWIVPQLRLVHTDMAIEQEHQFLKRIDAQGADEASVEVEWAGCWNLS